jgi:predicted secreted protein
VTQNGGVRRLLPLAVLLTVLVAGCSRVTTVSINDDTATVHAGDTLRVQIGSENPSIGDSWYVTTQGDPKVLGAGVSKLDSDCKHGEAGCGGTLVFDFPAVAKGQTDVEFRYCYRSGPDNCDPGPGRGPAGPVLMHVTVV